MQVGRIGWRWRAPLAQLTASHRVCVTFRTTTAGTTASSVFFQASLATCSGVGSGWEAAARGMPPLLPPLAAACQLRGFPTLLPASRDHGMPPGGSHLSAAGAIKGQGLWQRLHRLQAIDRLQPGPSSGLRHVLCGRGWVNLVSECMCGRERAPEPCCCVVLRGTAGDWQK